ncbi:DNA recombination protein RmuC [Paludibacterium paludis]|uniref:DNA recombination protein RmuC n=1 Tax=Paludibacterium paludis TaxID=1225769 RepID=A0A918P5T0_9NEIS|nr:DNA recombination protein RmuC [Paludibacterium paludis]GGY22429.1 DNA recombination protein RmuC [Paludibacterium paludis]
METLILLVAGLAIGGAGVWFATRSREAAGYERGVGEARLAQAELDAARGRLDEWRDRAERLERALADARDQLSATRERAERLPDIERRLAVQNEEIRRLSADVAGKSEQARQLAELRGEVARLREERDARQVDITRLTAREQELATQLASHIERNEENLRLLAEARETLSNQFKALANDILEEKSKRFTEQNRENLGQLLNPLNQRIQEFGKLVQDTREKDSRERLTLEQELRRLQELNTRLNEDAVALTRALTGASNKTQGNWGEMVLEKVLETSGLTRDREYRVQVSDVTVGEGGEVRRFQPDVVIDLPDNKHLVVDSKVSLNAYVRYTASADEAERQTELKSHIGAIRNHIRSLSEKRYQDLYRLNTVDFVFMFIPVEPAYLLAVQHDMSLFTEAFERRIMVVGPSTLLATLRTVASIWRYEYQNQNAVEIARQSGAMYDKFVGFVESLGKLGRQLDQSRDMYQDAMKKLSSGAGNLVGRAERLRGLGIKAAKRLPAHLADPTGEEDAAD